MHRKQDDELRYLVGFSFFEGIGPLRFRVLKAYFGSASKIYTASKEELIQTGIGDKLIEKFCQFRKTFNPDAFLEQCQNKHIELLSEENSYYPSLLKEIKSAPFLLYAQGKKELLHSSLLLAVVGTRKPTPYGTTVTKTITEDLSRAGAIIVSGLAMGIDAVAHRAALSSGGSTIAVLGCGIDICYPAINKGLYEDIIKYGLILSEFPPGMRTNRGVFASRNRIIAGISRGVVVTEGASDSGSMITARFALEYGRDVFAVPGPITSSMSAAPIALLRDGAKPVSSATDILVEYDQIIKQTNSSHHLQEIQLTEYERTIVNLILEHGQLHIDELVRLKKMVTTDMFSIVSTLEVRGILQQTEHGIYSIASAYPK